MDRWGIKGLHHPQLAASLRACSQPGTTRNVIVGLGLAVALATAEATHGTVTLTLRTIRRCGAAAEPPSRGMRVVPVKLCPATATALCSRLFWWPDKSNAILSLCSSNCLRSPVGPLPYRSSSSPAGRQLLMSLRRCQQSPWLMLQGDGSCVFSDSGRAERSGAAHTGR